MKNRRRRYRYARPAETLEHRVLLAADVAILLDGIANVPESSKVTIGDDLFFSADIDGSREEIWKTDGTLAGTLPVTDLQAGVNTVATPLTEIDGALLFSVDTGSSAGLYVTDDSADGAETLVTLAGGGFSGAVTVGDLAFSVASQTGDDRLYVTDGTIAGTTLLTTIFSNPSQPVSHDGTVYIVDNRQLPTGESVGDIWTSGGTDADTILLTTLPGTISGLTSAGGNLILFGTETSAAGTVTSVYSVAADGASSEPSLVAQLPGQRSSIAPLVVGDEAYFAGNLSGTSPGVFATDGSSVRQVVDLSTFGLQSIVESDGQVYFTGESADGVELFVLDDSADGVTKVSEPFRSIEHLSAIPGGVVFDGFDGVRADLWASNGTAAGTVRAGTTSEQPLRDITSATVSKGGVYLTSAIFDVVAGGFEFDFEVVTNFDFQPKIDFVVTENAADGDVVGSLLTLPDGVSPADIGFADFTILSGDAGGAFAVVGLTGEVTIADSSALSSVAGSTFELVFGGDRGDGVGVRPATYFVEVVDINAPPVASGFAVTIDESTAVGTVVGQIVANDADAGDTLSYEILGGDEENTFAINSQTGEISVSQDLDFDLNSEYSLSVAVSDGQVIVFATAVITVTEVDSGRVDVTDGVLTVSETDGDDVVRVTVSGTDLVVSIDGMVERTVPLASVDSIIVNGGDGDDSITISNAVRIDAHINGGDGDDIIRGGGGNDVIRGDAGNDVLRGRRGDDIVSGGTGRDQVFGNLGADLLLGGDDADSLFGGNGDDILIGGLTVFDDNDEALQRILEEWTSGRSLWRRLYNITFGRGPILSGTGYRLLFGRTIFSDGDFDPLNGGNGLDLHL